MREKGFTLVEMLLVLAIIGILVTVIVPNVVGVSMETKKNKVQADLRLVQAALGQYYVRYNTFPTDAASDPTDNTWVNELLGMRPRVIDNRPTDPFAKVTDPANPDIYCYQYMAPVAAGDLPTYVVFSVGISGKETATVDDFDQVSHSVDCIFVTNASQVTP